MFKADGGGKNRAAEFLFPYLDALDSEIERDSCTALIADSIGVDRNAVQRDYSKWKTGRQSRQFVHDKVESGDALRGKPIEMNAELRLLAVVAVNMALYPEFRLSVEIKEIDDLPAKELFIAMEECFTHDESDFDSLLSRIQNQKLREFIAGRAASEEFKGNNASRLMEEGINKVIVKKRLIYKRNEITALMRSNERMGLGTDIDELLAEKKSIDAQIRKIEGR
jgi:DNA primase